MTIGSVVDPASDILITESAKPTINLLPKDEQSKIFDGCTAVVVRAGADRFFALTVRHAIPSLRRAFSIGGSFALETPTADLVDPEPVDVSSEVGLPGVAPEFDAALFEVFPANDLARQRLLRRALPLDRLLLPTFRPSEDLVTPMALCGFPRAYGSIDLELFPSLAQLHYVGVAARGSARQRVKEFWGTGAVDAITGSFEQLAAMETDSEIENEDGTLEPVKPLKGCSGAGYFLPAIRKSSGGYYSGLAGIHSQTVEATHYNGSRTRILFGPSAEVFITMLWEAPSGLQDEIRRIWPNFTPVKTPVIPWREDEPHE